MVTLRTPRPPLPGRHTDASVFTVDEVTEHRKHLPTPREVTVRFSKARFSPHWRPKPRNPWRWGEGFCQQRTWTCGSGGWRTPVSQMVFTHCSKYYLNPEQGSTGSKESIAPKEREFNTFQKVSFMKRSRAGQCRLWGAWASGGQMEAGMALASRPLCHCGPGPSLQVRLCQSFPQKLLKGKMNTDPLGNVFDPPSLSLPTIRGGFCRTWAPVQA